MGCVIFKRLRQKITPSQKHKKAAKLSSWPLSCMRKLKIELKRQRPPGVAIESSDYKKALLSGKHVIKAYLNINFAFRKVA